MSKFNLIQNSFTAGEVSEKTKGQREAAEYKQALEKLENFIVQKQGGAFRRPGFQYVDDINDINFDGTRIVPFIFSKNESYAVVINGNLSSDHFKIYKSDGTEATVDEDEFLNPSGGNYDPSNWNYAQSGDILVLTYSNPETEVESGYTIGFIENQQISPAMVIRTDTDEFKVVSFSHPNFISNQPEVGKLSPAVNRPYLEANIDPDIRLYIDTATVGSGRNLFAVDSSNAPVPFFEIGHVFTESVSSPTQMGAFFKVQSGGTTGIAWGQFWNADITEPSSNIAVGSDIITSTGHGLVTRDVITAAVTGGPGTTDPTISGYPLNGTSVYGDFFVRRIDANTFTLHPTQADADAATNTIDFTDAGDRGIRIQHKRINLMRVTVEVAFDSGLTAGAAAATDAWQESAWSAKRGFPRTCVFHESRLYFAGTKSEPDTVWMSNVGNIFNFMQRRLEQDSSTPTTGASTDSGYGFALAGDIKATDPFQLTIRSKQANIIQWMESQNALLLGTLGSEYTITGFDEIISNQSFDIKKQTDHGSSNTQAVSSGVSSLFVTRDGRSLRDFKFNRDNGSYISTNLSVLADHMVFKGFGGGASDVLKGARFKSIAYQPSRDVVWALTTNNELIGITFSREAEIAAWHYHPVRSGDSILSIGVLPNADGTFDQLWAVTERSIDGGTNKYLEKMSDDFEHDVLNNTSTNDDDVPFYVDAAVKITQGSTSTTVTLPNNDGAGTGSHLEGETVDVLAGDTVEKGLTVSSGTITMSAAVPAGTVVIVGLRYTAKIRTLDIEAGADFGSSEGNRQRVDRLAMRLYRSQGGDYGNINQASLYPIEYSDDTIFTGLKRLDFDITPDTENQIEVEHSDPTPFNLLSLTYRGVSYD